MSPDAPLQPVAASRVYQTESGQIVTATIHVPFPSGDEWDCVFEIVGLASPVKELSRGVDSMQALMHAFDGVRFHLEQLAPTLSWFGGEVGDFGLPRRLPYGFGREVEAHLERLVEAELTRLVNEKRARGKR